MRQSHSHTSLIGHTHIQRSPILEGTTRSRGLHTFDIYDKHPSCQSRTHVLQYAITQWVVYGWVYRAMFALYCGRVWCIQQVRIEWATPYI